MPVPPAIAWLRQQAQQDGLDPNKWFGNVELEVAKDIGAESATYVDDICRSHVACNLASAPLLVLGIHHHRAAHPCVPGKGGNYRPARLGI